MARGQEETSTSLAGRKRGTPRELPTTISLVSAMSIEELRSFYKVPTDISMDLSDRAAVSTVRGVDNAVCFIGEAIPTLHQCTSYAHIRTSFRS